MTPSAHRIALRLVGLALIATGCGDPESSQDHDAAAAIDAFSAIDAVPLADAAPPIDAVPLADAVPGCGPQVLGPGLRSSAAFAGGHFAVAYLAVGGNLTVAQFTEAGVPAGAATAPVQLPYAIQPAIAGIDTFLAAYRAPPDGAVGLVPVTPGGGLGTTVPVASTATYDLLLAASPAAAEYALTFAEGQTARFARVAADGTVLVGPTGLGLATDEHVTAFAYRPGGWALVVRLQQTVRLLLVDNDGAITSMVALPDNSVVGGMVWTGTELALTWWVPFELHLRRCAADGTAIGADQTLAVNVFSPGGLATSSQGFAASYTGFTNDLRLVHATTAGVVASDHVLGSDADILPSVAVSPGGVRAASWGAEGGAPPVVSFALDCP